MIKNFSSELNKLMRVYNISDRELIDTPELKGFNHVYINRIRRYGIKNPPTEKLYLIADAILTLIAGIEDRVDPSVMPTKAECPTIMTYLQNYWRELRKENEKDEEAERIQFGEDVDELRRIQNDCIQHFKIPEQLVYDVKSSFSFYTSLNNCLLCKVEKGEEPDKYYGQLDFVLDTFSRLSEGNRNLLTDFCKILIKNAPQK